MGRTGEASASADGGCAIATIAAKNYLSFVRVLVESLRAVHPEITVFCLLTDEVDGYFDPAHERFRLLTLSDVGIPDVRRVRFRYDQKQLAVAAKPFVLGHLLDQGFTGALFLDPDILVLNDLAALLAKVRRHAVVLLPHLLAPLAGPSAAARELNILLSGTFNAGCVGVSQARGGRDFLAWWQARVLRHCRHDVAAGVYFDQRWLDLAPVFFDDVFVLRDATYNVAHWNLPERRVDSDAQTVLVDGRPGRFFHFSGFDPDRPEAVSRYSTRLTVSGLGSAGGIFRRYAALLEAAGYPSARAWPYAYGRFDNGVPVTPRMRELYADLGDDVAAFGDPLKAGHPGSFWHWLRRAGEVGPRMGVRR